MLRFSGERGNQLGSLNDQIGFGERDLRGAPIGEQLEAADLVEDAGVGRSAKLIAKMIGDDRVREAGSKSGFDSSTRTLRPPRASVAAV